MMSEIKFSQDLGADSGNAPNDGKETKIQITDVISMNDIPKVEPNAEFQSFLELRNAIEKYQKENSVQLIVKDSKLLEAESTRKVIPKVYHLVNQKLMYHSITYCCKCHGELKQKPGTRVRNVGAKRLNCPMYIRFKLTPDLQRLVIFDMDETHNHGIDPNTCQMPPRQQVYRLSRMRKGQLTGVGKDNIGSLIASAIRDVTSVPDTEYQPAAKQARIKEEAAGTAQNDGHTETNPSSFDRLADPHAEALADDPESPLDSESSCSDSDDEELQSQRQLLPFPIRLIGSAIQSSPELIEASKQLIELQKSKLMLEKQKLQLQTRNLELENSKLELEVKMMEKNLASEIAATSGGRQDTTIYLQAS
ncbi:uncharacterized protein LOC101851031 [Aplysia californica]|uniref:Uncharacterized protein LOC101851031 n=1 Tax=Aplysia californica TaxID=6500 RepID=A0ABM0JKY0_APLCA|nr:uncharacterized protein LOC101851031 [Aplysia californica]XP_005096143.1 uncharacterized protein LOC101851031 [Aplysia californica]XP_005096144.1 uncharacterized protein LOC101851031 [Aplysia californica]XP_005096145.1 uncharacterized protein LOC101851031 [Aplysia californica]